MSRSLALLGVSSLVALLWTPLAVAEDPFVELSRAPKNQSYRTSYGEKKLEVGVDGGYNFLFGGTARAFDPFATVTPYFDISFGDGNSLTFQSTLGYNKMDPEQAEYYFWRSPFVEGTSAEGELRFAIPTVNFRYETDLSSTMGRRGRAFFWAGMGVGAGLVSTAAQVEGAGTLSSAETSHEDTLSTYVAIVPGLGFRFRLTEFFFANLSFRYNVLFQFGHPEIVEEGDMPMMRTFDSSVGVSYEFGPS